MKIILKIFLVISFLFLINKASYANTLFDSLNPKTKTAAIKIFNKFFIILLSK